MYQHKNLVNGEAAPLIDSKIYQIIMDVRNLRSSHSSKAMCDDRMRIDWTARLYTIETLTTTTLDLK